MLLPVGSVCSHPVSVPLGDNSYYFFHHLCFVFLLLISISLSFLKASRWKTPVTDHTRLHHRSLIGVMLLSTTFIWEAALWWLFSLSSCFCNRFSSKWFHLITFISLFKILFLLFVFNSVCSRVFFLFKFQFKCSVLV